MSKNDLHKQLINLLKELHLPMFREYYAEFAQKALAEGMGYAQYLFELAQRECEVRRANKIARLVKASKLPMEKTLDNFDLKRMPLKIRQQLKILLEGSFVDRTENILAFGRPGSGVSVDGIVPFETTGISWGTESVPCAGDLGGGCGVDFVDFAIFASYWLNDCAVESCGPANLDESDEQVNWSDLDIFAGCWLWGK
jgi:hypothetical protein